MINHSKVNSDTYQKHHVFDEIGQMMDYYEGVSDTCYSFMPHGTRGIVNLHHMCLCRLKGLWIR